MVGVQCLAALLLERQMSEQMPAATRRLSRSASLVLCVGCLAYGGCRPTILPYPAVYSPIPLQVPRESRTLKAGVARLDITPPPGGGLMGYGPEGYRARGHRQRLYARALVLEDRDGERYAFVAVDLNGVPAGLHRKVAERLASDALVRVGVDRLIIGATHTHSAPSHYYGHPAFDELGSDVSGFDPKLLAMLIDRVDSVVRRAFGAMHQAKVAWGVDSVWGMTRIRDFPAYQQNDPAVRASLLSRFKPPNHLTPREAGVDATWGMLRVDTYDSLTRKYVPVGGMSVFAIHNTAIPGGQELYDSDVDGLVSRFVEQDMSPGDAPYDPSAVHVFFNGGEGDSSPNVDPATRCPTPMLVRTPVSRGPRDMAMRTTWETVPRDTAAKARCERIALAEMLRLARSMADRALELHARLGSQLSDDISIRRAFMTIHVGMGPIGSMLCAPTEGVASTGGAEDGYSRMRWNWPLLLMDSTTDPHYPGSPRNATGCQAEKRPFLFPFTSLLAGPKPLPDALQLSVVQIGDVVLAAVPGEATTHSSWMIRRAVADALYGPNASTDNVLIVGLANGYSHYFASPSEYPKQFYEGSATEFGPKTVDILAKAFRSLANAMKSGSTQGDWPSDTVLGRYNKAKDVLDWNGAVDGNDQATIRRTMTGHVFADSVVVEWNGAAARRFYDGRGTSAFFEDRGSGNWRTVAWDDQPAVEMRVDRRGHGTHYSVVWRASLESSMRQRFRLRVPDGDVCFDFNTNGVIECKP